jgi:hypothetical protein
MSFEKKNTFTHCASGSQFTCAPYNIQYIPSEAETGSAGDRGSEYAWHAGANRNFLPLKVKLSSEIKILEKEWKPIQLECKRWMAPEGSSLKGK